MALHCYNLMTHPIIQFITTMVVVSNCIVYIYYPRKTPQLNSIERLFFVYYVIEMVLKMLAFGLWRSSNAYLKSGWNLIDFFIIVAYFYNNSVNINVGESSGQDILKPNFGSFRVIRILKVFILVYSCATLLTDYHCTVK